jgi:hypothetical protein
MADILMIGKTSIMESQQNANDGFLRNGLDWLETHDDYMFEHNRQRKREKYQNYHERLQKNKLFDTS